MKRYTLHIILQKMYIILHCFNNRLWIHPARALHMSWLVEWLPWWQVLLSTSTIFCWFNCTSLVLYYDELELCNPLGSRRKKPVCKVKFSTHTHAAHIFYNNYYTCMHVMYRCILLSPWEHKCTVSIQDCEYSASHPSEVFIYCGIWYWLYP